MILKRITRSEEKNGRRVVICLDGTWNYPEQTLGTVEGDIVSPTNVYRIFSILAKKDTNAYYQAGPGNEQENLLLGQLFGGAFGAGGDSGVKRAYLQLLMRWHEDAEIYLFGFSRGAAMARMLAAKLASVGLPEELKIVKEKMRGSRRGWRTRIKFYGARKFPKVRFLGIFDTVASFGIPRDLLGIPFQDINLFKDFKVGKHVEEVLHLVALDERREAFDLTPVDGASGEGKLREIWMPGVHSDVGGGGNLDRGLSDLSLELMVNSARSAGLGFRPDWKKFLHLSPNPLASIGKISTELYGEKARFIPEGASFHSSVADRIKQIDGYHPELSEVVLAQV